MHLTSALPYVQPVVRKMPYGASMIQFFRAAAQELLVHVLMPLMGITITRSGTIPATGSYIIAANHASHLDTAVVLKALGRVSRRRLRIAASKSYFFESGTIRRCLAQAIFNLIPASIYSLVRSLKEIQEKKQMILIYPEGTRSRTGEMGVFRSGIGRLHRISGIPVIPVWIDGTAKLMPPGARLPRRGAVTLILGEPRKFDKGEDGAVAKQIAQAVRELKLRHNGRCADTEQNNGSRLIPDNRVTHTSYSLRCTGAEPDKEQTKNRQRTDKEQIRNKGRN